MTTVSGVFWAFAIAHLVVWTLVPTISNPNAPLDVVEMAYWGREWQLGYFPHPPLAAWATEAALTVGRGSIWTVYLLSQLAVLTCVWAAWRLAQDMVAPRTALLAALLLECCFYYNFTTPEFNNNIALYPFWALVVLFLYRSLETKRNGYWTMTGLAAGLGLLAKYSMIMLIVPAGLFLVLNRRARRSWSTPGPYLAAVVAMALFAPHLYWAGQHRFPAFSAALDRTHHGVAGLSRLAYSAAFASAQGLALLPMILVVLPLTGSRWHLRRIEPAERFKRDILVALAIGPFLLHLAASLALGLKLRSMYGSQLWVFSGLLMVFFLEISSDGIRWRRTAIAWGVVGSLMIVAAVAYAVGYPYAQGRPLRIHFPGRALARQVEEAWHQRYRRPLPVVAGEWWLAGNVALYSPHRPTVYGGAFHPASPDPAPDYNFWASDAELKRRGGAILWTADLHGDAIPRPLALRFPAAMALPPLALSWQTGAAVPPIRIGIAIVPPGATVDESPPHRQLQDHPVQPAHAEPRDITDGGRARSGWSPAVTGRRFSARSTLAYRSE